MTSLEEKFAKRPKKGTLQNRAALMQALLNENNGRLLVGAVAKLGRHIAQLAIEIQDAELGFVTSYDKAVPIFGIASVMARRSAANATGSLIHDLNKKKDSAEE